MLVIFHPYQFCDFTAVTLFLWD